MASHDKGKEQLIEQINRLHGYRTLKRAEEHGLGTRQYTLINID